MIGLLVQTGVGLVEDLAGDREAVADDEEHLSWPDAKGQAVFCEFSDGLGGRNQDAVDFIDLVL
jgi:hypothetical protein